MYSMYKYLCIYAMREYMFSFVYCIAYHSTRLLGENWRNSIKAYGDVFFSMSLFVTEMNGLGFEFQFQFEFGSFFWLLFG